MTRRPYLRLIQESVQNDGVTFEEITPDYIYRVKRGQLSFVMLDTEVGLNNSSSSKIARSKSATFDVLQKAGIPAVEHVFLANPASRFCEADSYALAGSCFDRFQGQVVLKPDNGSQGKHVYKISDKVELKETLKLLFSLELNAAISPYCESGLEYRAVVLGGRPRLVLAKQKTTSWKHNLIEGAVSMEVNPDDLPILGEMASRSSKALDLQFCSVDILDTNKGLMVIEVNDKVMLDEFRKQDEAGRRGKISAVYRDAILQRLGGQG